MNEAWTICKNKIQFMQCSSWRVIEMLERLHCAEIITECQDLQRMLSSFAAAVLKTRLCTMSASRTRFVMQYISNIKKQGGCDATELLLPATRAVTCLRLECIKCKKKLRFWRRIPSLPAINSARISFKICNGHWLHFVFLRWLGLWGWRRHRFR